MKITKETIAKIEKYLDVRYAIAHDDTADTMPSKYFLVGAVAILNELGFIVETFEDGTHRVFHKSEPVKGE